MSLAWVAALLAITGCRSLVSPILPTPPPSASPTPCEPGQYLNKIFPDVMTTKGVVYSQVSDAYGVHVLRMDIYEGVGDTAPLRPAILWMFGGNYSTGEKDQLKYFAAEFARRGYVTAAIEYRKLKAFGPNVPTSVAEMAAQSDTQAAIRYLRLHAAELSLDPVRVAVGGFSAGSIAAFNVGYKYEYTGDNTDNPGPPHTVLAVMGLDGFLKTAEDMRQGDPAFVLFRSGLGNPPRDDDSLFPALIAQSNALGIPHEVHVVSGAKHLDLIKHPYDQSIVPLAAPFLRTFVACR